MDIQWYPGHMTKTKRMLVESISLVDIVVELLDARIPYSSKNPDIESLCKQKKRIILLNKSDLADTQITENWVSYYKELGINVILLNSVTGEGVNGLLSVSKEVMKERLESLKAKGRLFAPIKAMVVGIPNVGKSTLINRIVGKSSAKAQDKPGVTRGKQWFKIKKDFWLLDTPGILWPKFEDMEVGLNLALTGAINDKIMDIHTLSLKLIEKLTAIKPECLCEKYKIDVNEKTPDQILEDIGRSRGFLLKGGEINLERTSITLTDEFRAGKLGRISLEAPCIE